MSITTLTPQRTAWDVILGILVVVAGIVLLGNTVVATPISVLFLGWMALTAGIVLVIASLICFEKTRPLLDSFRADEPVELSGPARSTTGRLVRAGLERAVIELPETQPWLDQLQLH